MEKAEVVDKTYISYSIAKSIHDTCSASLQDRFWAVLAHYSSSRVQHEAILEWEPRDGPEQHCICSHLIAQNCRVTNRLNGNQLVIGNVCIDKFFGPDAVGHAKILTKEHNYNGEKIMCGCCLKYKVSTKDYGADFPTCKKCHSEDKTVDLHYAHHRCSKCSMCSKPVKKNDTNNVCSACNEYILSLGVSILKLGRYCEKCKCDIVDLPEYKKYCQECYFSNGDGERRCEKCKCSMRSEESWKKLCYACWCRR